jgi:hypothetical protein
LLGQIQYNIRLLDEPHSSFHLEFGMSSEFDSGYFNTRDDVQLCDMTDHSLSLPKIGIQFSNKKPGQTPDLPFESLFLSIPISISTASGPGDRNRLPEGQASNCNLGRSSPKKSYGITTRMSLSILSLPACPRLSPRSISHILFPNTERHD